MLDEIVAITIMKMYHCFHVSQHSYGLESQGEKYQNLRGSEKVRKFFSRRSRKNFENIM